mmetsp:Transcript_9090/g.26998  ORF Transcript_9090/g.26998 Transcript_9090/m.26998 type:complete len:218 (-) Transcript_9090:801-1454(-)
MGERVRVRIRVRILVRVRVSMFMFMSMFMRMRVQLIAIEILVRGRIVLCRRQRRRQQPQQLRGRDRPVARDQKLRIRIEAPRHAPGDLHLFVTRQVFLVDHHQIGRLDLFRQQVSHLLASGAVPQGCQGVPAAEPSLTVLQDVVGHVIAPKGGGIDHRHDAAQLGRRGDQRVRVLGHHLPPLVADRQGIGHARELDHNGVVRTCSGCCRSRNRNRCK